MGSGVQLSPFEEVLADFKAGKMCVIVDDDKRENEGDIAIATEALTPEAVAFMMRHARGLICVSIPVDLAERINLPLQVLNNNSPFNTPFTISVDHRDAGTNGVTAFWRCHAMKRLLQADVTQNDFISPGHIFPLVANPSGVLGRQGQTEGSYDLARIAGYYPSGVICEILNPDGTVARGAELQRFADEHGLKITSVEAIIRYRVSQEVLVREVLNTRLATALGEFETRVFEDDVDGKEHLALVLGNPAKDRPPLVRLHSECLTGDVFGSCRCDCGPQLWETMERMLADGGGIILYLRQEGRGIGLANKLRAYQLQDSGHDTVEANVALGFEADSRDFAVAANILRLMNVSEVRLMTNNPRKIDTLKKQGIAVSERVPVIIPPNPHSRSYLETKRSKLGHLL